MSKTESFFSMIWYKERMSTLTTSFNVLLEILVRALRPEKEIKKHSNKKEIKYLLADHMRLYI